MISEYHRSIHSILQSETSIKLKLEEHEKDGIVGIRPEFASLTPAFIVAMSSSISNFEATLIHDLFSGEVIRNISLNINEVPELWSELMTTGQDEGLVTIISIDGDRITLEELPPAPWHSLEIECSARVPRKTPEDKRIEITSMATKLCLNFALLGLNAEEISESPIGELEGAVSQTTSTRYERSRINRKRCIRFHGCVCFTCKLDFEEKYGEIGEGFIEVHHKTPISQIKKEYRVDPVNDLIPLCSNCHSMIHRNTENPNIPWTPEELIKILDSSKN